MGVCPIPQGRWAPQPGPLPRNRGGSFMGWPCPLHASFLSWLLPKEGKQAASLTSCSTRAEGRDESDRQSVRAPRLPALHTLSLLCPSQTAPVGTAAGAHSQMATGPAPKHQGMVHSRGLCQGWPAEL